MIIAIVVTLLILPTVFCILLAVRIGNLEKQIKELKKEGHKSLEIVWNEEDVIKTATEEEVMEETKEEENLRKVYLTFDDGPSIYTDEILDILKRYNVKATFFVTGMNLPQYSECFQKILDDGHSLGIHTYSHVYSEVYSSLEAFQEDFYKIRDCIYESTGEDIKIYRFPGGSSNTIVSKQVREDIMKWLKEENIQYYDWNVSSGDASSTLLSAEKIAENCLNGIKNRNTEIVLLHDSGAKKSTVEALPLIIEGINRLDDTILLPIDEGTVPIQQIRLTEE